MKLLRFLVTAFVNGTRPELPHPRTASTETVYRLEWIGNNLNQLARQGNRMLLHLVEADARRAIARLHALFDKLIA